MRSKEAARAGRLTLAQQVAHLLDHIGCPLLLALPAVLGGLRQGLEVLRNNNQIPVYNAVVCEARHIPSYMLPLHYISISHIRKETSAH